MDIKSLASDRRVQLAAGGGAALGLVALLRKKSTASSATSGAATNTTGAVGTLGTYDSSGTDAYNNFSNTLDQFAQQITTIQDQLAGQGTPTAPRVTPVTVTHTQVPQPKPVVHVTAPTPKKPTTNKPAGPVTVKVTKGQTLSGIAASHHLSLKTIERLNPQIKNPNLIRIGQYVRVK